jgi:hypothetical protein
MTELIQNSGQTTEEGQQTAAILDEAAHDAPALRACSSMTPNTEAFDDELMLWPRRKFTERAAASPRRTENVNWRDAPQVGTPGNTLSPPLEPDCTIDELHTQMKRIVAGRTNLSDNTCAILAFWAMSTWFQGPFIVFPGLLITGDAHQSMVLLRVLHDLCAAPMLLAGFRRADLKDLEGYRTLLISEPNLDNRTAALLGNLTNRDFTIVEQGYYLRCAGSRAIYIGEDLAIKRIQHFLYLDTAARPHTISPNPRQSLPATIEPLRNRLLKYRERNLGRVRCLEFNPYGLSPEALAMANAIGSCIVDATQLQTDLVSLLRPQDQQQIADRSNSVDALIADAALTLSHQGKDQVFVKEIASEVNRLLEIRGEIVRLSPGKVGHKLRKVGLLTRRLSQAGNGLTLDQATRIRHGVAKAYRREDSTLDTENLHCPLCSQNECFRDGV